MLGFLYAHLAQENVLSESQRALCAFKALQILSLLCKRYTLFYEAPDFSLWKKFAELYLLADTQRWLTLKIDDRVTGLLRQPAIEDVVKHALVFYGCHPYRYAASEIAAIFAATADLTQWLRLDPAPSDFDMCSWIPNTFLPPLCANSQNPEAPVISINTSDLIDHFERHPEATKKLKIFPGLLNRLTAYHDVRCSVDPARPNRCGLIMGNAQASKFLNLLISRYRVLELTDSLEKHIKTTKLELVPLEIRNTMASLSSKILTDVKNISSRQLTIFETNESAFWCKVASLLCAQ